MEKLSGQPDRRRLVAFVAAALLSVGVTAGIGEAYLRHSQKFADYFEKNGLRDFGHVTEYQVAPWLWVRRPNDSWTQKKAEFEMKTVQINAEGLVGQVLPLRKGSGEYRIIAVGDSFTEGVGDVEGSGYPSLLESELSGGQEPKKYRVMNAGISGSDPVFGLELIRRRLSKYRPDLVLLTINLSDITDLERRGGLDRFGPDGYLKPLKVPSWTWLFDHSHLVRAFVLGVLGYDWELRPPSQSVEERRTAIRCLVRTGIDATQLARQEGFRLMIVVHPHWWEVLQRRLEPELLEVEEGLQGAGVEYVDLLEGFLSRIPGEITPDYYWAQDAHFTHKGYEVFAGALKDELMKRAWFH